MMEPVPSSVEQCPFCRKTIRRTAEVCPGCGAERQYGPTRRESLTTTGIGLVAGPAAITVVGAGLTLAVVAGVIGALMGFFVAHARHSVDRWMPPPRKPGGPA
ncbi:hypothetical protein JUN65_09415 [Gluconacetobacter azotocaptans]|uniref:hypothetical protein n=1 Tax=Gluconacetobacter azotocaptans TaxID=142834 RepID=UPI001958798A|nr:hypothetical protein [Gluconacetobacter azotocaptans]MBM9401803.1 hypothetical protein [Gluconacetobacter azotocaptans]